MMSSCSSPKPTILGLTFNGHDVTLNFLVNDVLMTLFFGLAVKEITEALQEGGSLYPVSKAVNPLIGTLGGVLGPIIVYFVTLIIQNAVGSFGSQDSFAVIANG
jgi:NhaA family Na+:H+ antiporter